MPKLTLRDLFAAKGRRHLTQVFIRTASEAAACEEAGILTGGRGTLRVRRNSTASDRVICNRRWHVLKGLR